MISPLTWNPAQGPIQRSPCGYQVTATREGAGWLYSAWSPESSPELRHWDWFDAHCKPHYRRGEAVPQRRRFLGVAQTAAGARALCEAAQLNLRGETWQEA